MKTTNNQSKQDKAASFAAFLDDVASALGHERATLVDLRVKRTTTSRVSKSRPSKAQVEADSAEPVEKTEKQLRYEAYIAAKNKPEWHPEIADTPFARERAAKALVEKIRGYGWKTRKHLLTWLRETERAYSGFPMDAILKLGFKTRPQVAGTVGHAIAELNKETRPAVEALMQFPVEELRNLTESLSLANIRARYNRDLSPAEVKRLCGPETLRVERDVDAADKRQLSGWARSKQNREVAAQRKAEAARLAAREKRLSNVRAARPSLAEYTASLRADAAFYNEGMERREQWMHELEERTKTPQKRSNLQ